MALPSDPSRLILTDADLTRPGPLRDALGGGSVGLPGYDIIVIAGQSNAAGAGGPYSPQLDPTTPTIDQYGAKNRTIRAASEPLDMVNNPTGMGPGLQFARWYASQLAPGRKVLVVPAAKGGTRLSASTGDSWRATRPTPSLYAAAIEQTQEAVLAAGPGTHRVVAVIWLQGEADSSYSIAASTYQTDLDNLIDAFRSDLSDPRLPFLIGPMVHEWVANGGPGSPAGTAADINAVHADTPNRKPHTGYVPATPDMPHNPADVIHWPGPAQRIIGRRLHEEWQRIASGSTADSAPPVEDTGWVDVDWLPDSDVIASISRQRARKIGNQVTFDVRLVAGADGSAVRASAIPADWRITAGSVSQTASAGSAPSVFQVSVNSSGTVSARRFASTGQNLDFVLTWLTD